MNYSNKILIVLLLFVTACFPKEDKVIPKPRRYQSVFLDAGPTKNDVVFYSLDEGKIVAKSSPMEWDIYVDESVIRINYFRNMQVAPVTNLDWKDIKDTSGLTFSFLTDQFDHLSQWEIEENTTYMIDMGVDNEYNPMGFRVLKIERSSNQVIITSKLLEEEDGIQETVSATSFYYNLREQKIHDLPKENEYDIAFGKYTDYITVDDISQDYTIYGAILGESSAYLLEEDFENVSKAAFNDQQLTSRKDVIGWDWKKFNLSKNAYEIIPNKTYMISTNAKYQCKLRFVNYLNDLGISGHPTFEYQIL